MMPAALPRSNLSQIKEPMARQGMALLMNLAKHAIKE